MTRGTRPSKKTTNLKDVKRYLNLATIAKDGLLVVPHTSALSPTTELILVPRFALSSLVTALHLRLDHPTKHQLSFAIKRHFHALDLPKAIHRVYDTCHTCASLRKLPPPLLQQTTSAPPAVVGTSFATDLLRRCKQAILVLRESSTSFTLATIISDEKGATLRDNLVSIIITAALPHGTHRHRAS